MNSQSFLLNKLVSIIILNKSHEYIKKILFLETKYQD